MKTIRNFIFAALLSMVFMGGQARGDFVITFEPASSPWTTAYVSFSGSASGTSLNTQLTDVWDYLNFTPGAPFDFSGSAVTTNITGVVRNLTLGTTNSITSFTINGDGGGTGAADISFTTDAIVGIREFDDYEVEISGVFDGSGDSGPTLYPSLNIGTYTSPEAPSNSGNVDNIFGDAVLIITVPEPTSMIALLGMAPLGLMVRRRR